MKNIYVLPTNKPSRLFLNKVNNKLLSEDISNPSLKKVLPSGSYQNIYITNDEEIKVGDWTIATDGGWKDTITKITGIPITDVWKKIILTTDQDLIKDGVQAIDNTFAEWFVKNPSCEYVEVEIKPMFPMYSTFIESIDNPPFYGNLERKIIIPQEEPKPHSFCETPDEKCTMNYCDENGCQNRKRELVEPQEEPKQSSVGKEFYESADEIITVYKQEKIKEAAENYSIYNEQVNKAIQEAVKFGAKWMEERSYSEEDMLSFLDWSKSTNKEKSEYELKCLLNGKDIDSKKLFIMWFEQFKKK